SLRAGENWIAALVWNFGRWAPMAQHTVRTGFVFCLDSSAGILPAVEADPGRQIGVTIDRQGESRQDAGATLNTPGAWEVARLPGWDFDMMHSGVGEFYIDVGPGEISTVRHRPEHW